MWVKNVDVQGYYLYLEQINLSVNTEYWFKKKKFEITDIYKFSFPKWSYIYAYKKITNFVTSQSICKNKQYIYFFISNTIRKNVPNFEAPPIPTSVWTS